MEKAKSDFEIAADAAVPEMEQLSLEEMQPVLDIIERHFMKSGYKHLVRRLRKVYKAKKQEAQVAGEA